MMTFQEFQATKMHQVFGWSDDQECWQYEDDLVINISSKTGEPYLEIANECYYGTLEELELILYGWALEEGCLG